MSEVYSKPISYSQSQLILEYIDWFHEWLCKECIRTIRREVRYYEPEGEIAEIEIHLTGLKYKIEKAESPHSIFIEDMFLPILKLVLQRRRRELAMEIEALREKTFNPQILNTLDSKIKPIDDLIGLDILRNVKPTPMPRLARYLTIQILDELQLKISKQVEREYDEKFHILQAPRQFLHDLRYYRLKCETRGVPLVVAYLDIDDFKRFNTKYGESQVDQKVLPMFMEALEAVVFAHGFAYRYGGDEYVILLPNLYEPLAGIFLEHLSTLETKFVYIGHSQH